MKKTALVATAGFLAVGTMASADTTLSESFELGPSESISFEVIVTDTMTSGFFFSGFYDDLADDGSWASDMRMDIDGPGGVSYSIGGFDTPGTDVWDFDGGGSDEDGTYTHDGFSAFSGDAGTYTVTFENNWGASGGHGWDVELTIFGVPAPGALALLGVAGLVGVRRRRA